MINVIVIDDDIELAIFYKDIINSLNGFACNNVYESTYDFLVSRDKVDIIILDLMMPKINGIDSISVINRKFPNSKIIVNSIKEDISLILASLKGGANGYLDKYNFKRHIENALLTVICDEAYLSPKITKQIFSLFNESGKIVSNLTNREKDIARGIFEGLSYKLIADKYDLSIDTVRMYIKKLYRKLNINSKAELINKLNSVNNLVNNI